MSEHDDRLNDDIAARHKKELEWADEDDKAAGRETFMEWRVR